MSFENRNFSANNYPKNNFGGANYSDDEDIVENFDDHNESTDESSVASIARVNLSSTNEAAAVPKTAESHGDNSNKFQLRQQQHHHEDDDDDDDDDDDQVVVSPRELSLAAAAVAHGDEHVQKQIDSRMKEIDDYFKEPESSEENSLSGHGGAGGHHDDLNQSMGDAKSESFEDEKISHTDDGAINIVKTTKVSSVYDSHDFNESASHHDAPADESSLDSSLNQSNNSNLTNILTDVLRINNSTQQAAERDHDLHEKHDHEHDLYEKHDDEHDLYEKYDHGHELHEKHNKEHELHEKQDLHDHDHDLNEKHNHEHDLHEKHDLHDHDHELHDHHHEDYDQIEHSEVASAPVPVYFNTIKEEPEIEAVKSDADVHATRILTDLVKASASITTKLDLNNEKSKLIRDRYRLSEEQFDLVDSFFVERQKNNGLSKKFLRDLLVNAISTRQNVQASEKDVERALDAIEPGDALSLEKFIELLLLFFSSKHNLAERLDTILKSRTHVTEPDQEIDQHDALEFVSFLDHFYDNQTSELFESADLDHDSLHCSKFIKTISPKLENAAYVNWS